MLQENILKQIMVRSINKVDSFSSSSDQTDIVTGTILNNLTPFNTFQPFQNRICSIRWIPKRPYALLVGGKHGELCCIPDVNRYTISGNDEKHVDMISKGIGPGGEIREMISDAKNCGNFYSLNVSGELVKVDIATHDINVLQPQGDFAVWYAGLNVNFDKKVIVMGDNKGIVHILPDSTHSGTHKRSKVQCHKSGKINHIEFHPRDSNLMATAATSDCCVKLWDIRMLRDFSELEVLTHNKGVVSCYFNRTGTRMVTTDQGDELRIYSSGDWSLIKTIKHPHRFYQYLTPIRAEWHTLADIIVVGHYPTNSNLPKYVDFFHGHDGKEIMSLPTPNNKICSYNRFNYTGDILASMFQAEIVIWKQKTDPDDKENKKEISNSRRRIQSESSSSSDDDDDDDDDYSKRAKGKRKGKSQGNAKKVSKTDSKAKKTPAKKEARKLPPRNPKKKG